jgi:hypothetical protein
MKRFLKHKGSGRFLADAGWTEDRRLAIDFPNCLKAIEAVQAHQLSDMELVLQVEEMPSGLDLALPLRVTITGRAKSVNGLA